MLLQDVISKPLFAGVDRSSSLISTVFAVFIRYFSITNEQIHTLVGNGKRGPNDIQNLKRL